ncbi:MAG: TonB-dependent receptor [Pseudomonadota bacterium]
MAVRKLGTGLLLTVCCLTDVAAQSNVIDEIKVTAQRRETDLQSTAAAVTALTAEDMAIRSIDDIEDLGLLSPSMNVALYQGEAQIYIRGIGYSGIIGGSDSSTALHQDGVYLSRSSAAVPAFFDVERLEVVRGPQGTLYGRNATGGSVNVITRGGTESFSAETALTAGNFSRFRTFGAISGPLSDRVQFRLAAQAEQQDGFTLLNRPVADPLSGAAVTTDVEDTDEYMVRGTLDVQFSDSVALELKADYYEADDANSVWLYVNPGTGTNAFYRQYLLDRGGFVPEDPLSRRQDSDLPHFNRPRIWGLSGKLTWDIGDYTLTSLTALKHTNPLNRNDLDSTGAFGVDQLREEDHEQFSQEFQLSSPTDRRFSWIVGLYYFTEENDVRNEYFLPFVDEQFGLASDDECCLLQLNGFSETTALALFGEGTYQLTDRLDLVVGARYSDETRDGNNAVRLQNFPTPDLDNVAEFDEASFDDFTPKLGLNFSVSDNVFAYGSISQGFKSGGFNVGSYQNTPYEPEEITAYEFGVRSDLLENRLRVNSSVFFYDYQDYQFQDVENNNTVIRNAAEAEILGIEVETRAVIGDNVTLDFAATWLDAEFANFIALDPKAAQLGLQVLDGNRLPRAPEFKYSIGLQYDVELATGNLAFRADYAWQDDVFFSAFNVSQLFQEAFGWGKFRVSYTPTDGGWRLAAFVDNVSDEAVVSNATFNGDIIDSTVTGNMAPPRTYGIEALFRFGAE